MLRSLFRQTHRPSRVLWRRNLPKAFTVSLKPAHTGHWYSCKVVPAISSWDSAYKFSSPPCTIRRYCSLSESDVKKKIDEITDLFFDSRELLDDARSSVGTVYFNDDMQEAKSAVEETLQSYDDLLGVLSEGQRQTVISSIGLKMEELKAQLVTVNEQLEDS